MQAENQVQDNSRHKKLLETFSWLEKRMQGEAEKAGLETEEKVVAFVKEIRRESVH